MGFWAVQGMPLLSKFFVLIILQTPPLIIGSWAPQVTFFTVGSIFGFHLKKKHFPHTQCLRSMPVLHPIYTYLWPVLHHKSGTQLLLFYPKGHTLVAITLCRKPSLFSFLKTKSPQNIVMTMCKVFNHFHQVILLKGSTQPAFKQEKKIHHWCSFIQLKKLNILQ